MAVGSLIYRNPRDNYDVEPHNVARRLGYLLEHFTDCAEIAPLMAISDSRQTSISLLDPQSSNAGVVDVNWRLKINREVVPDE